MTPFDPFDRTKGLSAGNAEQSLVRPIAMHISCSMTSSLVFKYILRVEYPMKNCDWTWLQRFTKSQPKREICKRGVLIGFFKRIQSKNYDKSGPLTTLHCMIEPGFEDKI